MTTPSLEEHKELFKQLEGIKVTFADGSPSTTMDKEMHKALAKVSTETNNDSNNSNSKRKGKGKGKNKMRSNL
jgi:hypothetical protein